MKYYSYNEPDEWDDSYNVKVVMSSKEILEQYWGYWAEKMRQGGFVNQISPDRCIEDWCMIHWATPEDIFMFKRGYQGKLFCVDDWDPTDLEFERATIACVNDESVIVPGYINLMTEMVKVQ